MVTGNTLLAVLGKEWSLLVVFNKDMSKKKHRKHKLLLVLAAIELDEMELILNAPWIAVSECHMKLFLRGPILKASSGPLSYCTFNKAEMRATGTKWDILHKTPNIIVEGDSNNAFS